MQQVVSRKEFLGIFVLAILSVFGSSPILKLLTGNTLDLHKMVNGNGYTAAAYGGVTTSGMRTL